MENMINLLDLVRDKISLETFLDSSVMSFRDYFFTKNNVNNLTLRKDSIAK